MRIELKKRLSQQASGRHFPAGSMALCLEIKLCNIDRERKIIWPDEHTVTVKETSFMPVVFVCRFAVIVKWAATEGMFTQKHNNLAYCAQFPKECINSANILSAHLNPLRGVVFIQMATWRYNDFQEVNEMKGKGSSFKNDCSVCRK